MLRGFLILWRTRESYVGINVGVRRMKRPQVDGHYMAPSA
jgi:hypothetical protein